MSSRAACGAITVAEDKMHEASKMRNAGTTKEMTSYIRCFLQYARYKAAAALAMMVLLGLLEGSGLLLLLPLLTLLGLGQGHPDNFVATAIPALVRVLGIPFTLPIVLGLFVLFMSGQLWLRRWLDVFVARIENGFVVQLRAQLYDAMVHADWLFFTRQRGSEIAQVLTDEVDRIGFGTQQMLGLLSTAGVALVQQWTFDCQWAAAQSCPPNIRHRMPDIEHLSRCSFFNGGVGIAATAVQSLETARRF